MEPVGDLDSRQQALKPIQTKRSAGREVEGDGEKPEDIEEEEEPLSPAARIFHEPCFNVYVIAIVGCKTRINVDVIKANLGHTFLKHPRFSSLQVKDMKKDGAMKWVRTKVDLDKHVIVPRIHNTIDSPDKTVEDYISNLSKTSIDFSKPLWELHILNLKTSDAESIAVFRSHHSLGDGMSLMSLVLACTRQISNPEALPTLPVKKSSNPDPVNSGGIWWTIQLFWNTIVDVLMFVATALFLKDTVTPLSGVQKKGDGLGSRRFVYRTVSLDDIKLIKNGMKTTINDVVMGVSLAGLSRYLNRRYGEAKEDKGATEEKNNLPKNIRLRATLLMNIRPSPGIHAAAFLYHRVPNHTTMCFSNIVGPVEEVGFSGHPLVFLAPSVYGQPHGLMIHFQSYINKMTLVLSVKEEIVPDPHQLCNDLEESLKLIKDAVIAKGLAKENSTK
ncbi:wax ester synthase/diacylglycerol acyltransferase 5 isoform X2 [Vitis vinifera]|uniref:wax ester synthase/diacylglycerol acyltransferase 5 isoform X2 n=1 Tax=Vitis vinifera TaxID=29760 RepID=UPI0008FEB747|nr:wax ester synthase/diacylglycerol acyltransferase 5 isoform X2 [Vitis vinifera]WEO87158.1 O-acyltransferase WSD1 [Vitis vinifera]|eukprot:XP_019081272.1 PREDICTED: O-acyltransferase WSD1 isoform X2 [Vitis vinifera]